MADPQVQALRAEVLELEHRVANLAGWGRREWSEARRRLRELQLRLADLRDQHTDSGDMP